MSKKIFSEKIVCLPIDEATELANSVVKGKGFYAFEDENFLIKGSASSVLTVEEDKAGDMMALYNILRTMTRLLKIDNNAFLENAHRKIKKNISAAKKKKPSI